MLRPESVRLLVISTLLVAGCAAPRPHSVSAPASAPAPPAAHLDQAAEKAAQAHAHYGAGVIHEMNDEQTAALDEYYQAAVDDPGNESLSLEVSRRFLQHKDLDKALDLLSRCAARPQASGAIFARLGMVYSQLGKFDQAVAADRTAITRAPESLTGYQNLFLTYAQNKKDLEALKVLDEAARQPKADGEFLASLAELYTSFGLQAPTQKEKAFAKARDVLARAAKLGPPNPAMQLRLADGFNLLGDSKRAAQLYLELLKKLPDMPMVRERVHAKLADIYLRGSDHKAAREQLEAMLRDDPTNPGICYYLGLLAYEDRQPAQAVEYLEKTILLRPDFPDAYYSLALAQIGLDKPDDALATLATSRKKFPRENFSREFYSGLAATRKKAYADALRYYTAAEVIAKATDPQHLDQDLYFQLGASYERTGDLDQAERYFQKCLEAAPDFHEAQNYLGYMWAEHGLKLDQARDLIQKAVQAQPKNAAYLDSLGWVLFKLNQPQAALEQVLKAVELSVDEKAEDATLYEHLGDIYAALQQTEKARDAWTKSLALEPNDAVKKKLQTPAPAAPNP